MSNNSDSAATSPVILIAEDDPGISSIIRFVLESEGFPVAVARDGGEAIDMALALRPGLLLLDVVLPKIDGRGVTRELEKELGDGRPPIILLSASSKLSELAAELGVEGFVTKPFEPDDIVAVSKRHLG
jgi:two-component system response regulator AdeR